MIRIGRLGPCPPKIWKSISGVFRAAEQDRHPASAAEAEETVRKRGARHGRASFDWRCSRWRVSVVGSRFDDPGGDCERSRQPGNGNDYADFPPSFPD